MENWRMQEFSISDLEGFTGVKAHTIRIWEQRYGILNPKRTESNIRIYSDKDLKKLINVSMLNRLGFKISKIADMTDKQIKSVLLDRSAEEGLEEHVSNMLKIAMLNYDESLFSHVCHNYLETHDFEDLFEQVFIPFLYQVGVLWQADVICPAHEHFVSNMVRQKLSSAIDQLPEPADDEVVTHVLFLPQFEIHELGLMMIHYKLRKAGKRTVYLGQSVPLEDLGIVRVRLGECVFVSHITNSSSTKRLLSILKSLRTKFNDPKPEFWISGPELDEAESLEGFVVRKRLDVLFGDLTKISK